MYLFTLLVIVGLMVAITFRPKLRAPSLTHAIPQFTHLRELADWLDATEKRAGNVIEGAQACIQFANPDAPEKTRLCFVYIHGFSATWPETAPVTERLAQRYGANVLQARLAGHGTDPETMVTPAEDWLASMLETWDIAQRLGDKVVIIATSTGAPLSTWLATEPGVASRLHALLFMSPNFRIRSKFDFLITAPLSKHWLHLIIGRFHEWKPTSEAQARFWTWRYSTLALIEMQKCVDFAKRQDFGHMDIPLAVMYMKNDPTIDPAAAIRAYDRWGSKTKALIKVTIDEDEAEHVFTGDICAPKRTDWTIAQFAAFLDSLE